VPGFSLGGRPAPLHAGRLNAEDKHLPEEIGCPVVFLTSGQKLTLHKVMLYDEDGVREVAKLRAQAASGVFVDFAQVTNNQSPHPSVWSASVECKKRWENGSEWRRHVHNGDEFVNVETELGAMSIRWDQVAAYFPPQQSSEKLLIAPTESPDKLTQPRQLWTGWGQLAGTDVASGDCQADFIPPKGPSVNRPETLPVGTTIQDAGGVRLAVLPDGSVLTRSANDSRDISSSVEAMLANFIGAPCPLRRRP
jgi:hypothetical protein